MSKEEFVTTSALVAYTAPPLAPYVVVALKKVERTMVTEKNPHTNPAEFCAADKVERGQTA